MIGTFTRSDLSENEVVFVWKTERGDRLVAETIPGSKLIGARDKVGCSK